MNPGPPPQVSEAQRRNEDKNRGRKDSEKVLLKGYGKVEAVAARFHDRPEGGVCRDEAAHGRRLVAAHDTSTLRRMAAMACSEGLCFGIVQFGAMERNSYVCLSSMGTREFSLRGHNRKVLLPGTAAAL